MPWQKKSPWQKSKIMPVTFWGPIFFPRLRRGPFFYWDFVTIIFLAVTIFENAVTFLQKSSVACETCPWLFWKKLPVTFHACPWHWSKKVPVTCPNTRDNSQKVEMSRAKKFHGKKNTEPKERVASIILCFLLKSGATKGAWIKNCRLPQKIKQFCFTLKNSYLNENYVKGRVSTPPQTQLIFSR